ncbi:uncharacterized protein CCOS01_15879 [Colletotrichum costaricense]|uniref:Uncharacterized protein n=1 Tax=Colletotrichum costaricense TaxID=1209916 RepID=A0AAI9YGR8_9PEZI|nr:uncharacterized protein CCOS01_15879 [Colletotrichum costaricense]KAK1508218.1 hypothetical protein CCOS01_15879 [Colletotrichum costaricense]
MQQELATPPTSATCCFLTLLSYPVTVTVTVTQVSRLRCSKVAAVWQLVPDSQVKVPVQQKPDQKDQLKGPSPGNKSPNDALAVARAGLGGRDLDDDDDDDDDDDVDDSVSPATLSVSAVLSLPPTSAALSDCGLSLLSSVRWELYGEHYEPAFHLGPLGYVASSLRLSF